MTASVDFLKRSVFLATSILRACPSHVCFAITTQGAENICGQNGFTREETSVRCACDEGLDPK
jgi:hypothetical protein